MAAISGGSTVLDTTEFSNVNGKTTQAALYFSRHKMRLTRVNLLATSTQACKIPEDEGWVILPGLSIRFEVGVCPYNSRRL